MNLSTGDANEENPSLPPSNRPQHRTTIRADDEPPSATAAAEGGSSDIGPDDDRPLMAVPLSTSSSLPIDDVDPASERLQHKFTRRTGGLAHDTVVVARGDPLLSSESTAGGRTQASSSLLKKWIGRIQDDKDPGAAKADPDAEACAADPIPTTGPIQGAAGEPKQASESTKEARRRRRRQQQQQQQQSDEPGGADASQIEPARIRQPQDASQSLPSLSQPAMMQQEHQLPETDFYRNPTLLSRLLLNQKYKVAMGRLKRHPEEARVVLVARRSAFIHPSSPISNVDVSIRQLPIHLACLNLGRTLDPAMKEMLNQLITHLVVTFPEGCHMADHVNVLPIQYAVRHGAQASTVSLMLMAVPETRTCRDGHGRSLMQLNRACDSPYRKQVAQVLKLDVEFWRQSRQEANFRLQQQQPQHQPPEGSAAQSPLTTTSQPGAMAVASSSPVAPPGGSDAIEPVAWEQLEIRAIALEQILDEANEKNYTLHRRIEHLVEGRMDLLDHLDQLKQSSVVQETRALQRQNVALLRQLSDMRDRLRQTSFHSGQPAPNVDVEGDDDDNEEKHEIGATPTPRQQPRRRSESESSSLVGHSPLTPLSPETSAASELASESTRASTRALQTRSLQADNLKLIQANHELRDKYERLNREYKAQQKKLNKLVHLIRRLTKDTATILLSGAGTAGSSDEEQLEGDKGSRHTQKSHVSTLSGSPLTHSEASSISESANPKIPGDPLGGHHVSGKHRQSPRHHHHHHPSKKHEDSRSSAYPRRQRTIEIQWHSASTGLGGAASPRRRRRSHEDDEEEKMEEGDPDFDVSDSLSVLFARAIDHEASLPFAGASSGGAAPSPRSSRRRPSFEPSSPTHRDEGEAEIFSTPASSSPPVAVAAGPGPALLLDDLRIPALLEDAGTTADDAAAVTSAGHDSTPPTSL